MPLNPQVPLMAQPGPMIDLQANRARSMQLADTLQMHQMRQQLWQQQQEERQKGLAVEDALRAHPDNPEEALADIIKADPVRGINMRADFTKAKEVAADRLLKLDDDTLHRALERTETTARILNQHNSPELFPQGRQILASMGIDLRTLPSTYSKGAVDALVRSGETLTAQLADEAKRRELKSFPAGSAVTSEDRMERGLPPAFNVPKEVTPGSFEEYLSAPPERQKEILEGRKLYNQADDRPPVNVFAGPNTSIPGDFSKTGDDFLQTIPAQWRKTVEKIARYEEDPTRVASMRGGMREALMQWVNQANPAYKEDEFKNRAPTRKAFTTGTQGKQITNINTAIGHIDQFGGLAKQLENGGLVPGNEAWNTVRTMFGSDKVSNFDTLKDALAGEVAGVLAQSGATVSGIAAAEKNIHAAASPLALAGYVKTLLPIMGEKLGSMDYQFHQVMGDEDPWSPLSPRAKAILIKNGIDPEKLKGSYTGDTSTATAPTPALKAALDKQEWTDGKGHRVSGAPSPGDNGVWKRETNGTYTKVSN